MASDYRSFYVEQTPLLFLLPFRGRQFREQRIEQANQQIAIFYLLVGHAEHGLYADVGL